MKRSKIAIGSWAFSFGPFENNPWTFEQVCEYAGQNNYDGIEINGFRPHPHPDDYNTDEKCAGLSAMIKSHGLGISAYAADFREVPPALVSREEFLGAGPHVSLQHTARQGRRRRPITSLGLCVVYVWFPIFFLRCVRVFTAEFM